MLKHCILSGLLFFSVLAQQLFPATAQPQVLQPGIAAPDLHAEGAQELLSQLPGPVWLPDWLPVGFRLLDLRIHQQYHARLGLQWSYTLVYGNGHQSLMLHSRLLGYRSQIERCPVAYQQLLGAASAWEAPRELLLLTPACSSLGQVLLQAITPDEARQVWQSLRLRKSPGV